MRDPQTGFAIREQYAKGGEIIVQVPDVKAFAGYHGNPEATSKKFERNVFKKGDLWYRTGDALRRDDDGRWYFLDRLGDTFRWKGENVSTAEVAEVMVGSLFLLTWQILTGVERCKKLSGFLGSLELALGQSLYYR